MTYFKFKFELGGEAIIEADSAEDARQEAVDRLLDISASDVDVDELDTDEVTVKVVAEVDEYGEVTAEVNLPVACITLERSS